MTTAAPWWWGRPPLPTGPILSQFLWTDDGRPKWPNSHTLLTAAYPADELSGRFDAYDSNPPPGMTGYPDIDLAAMNGGNPPKKGDDPFNQAHWFIDSVADPNPLLRAFAEAERRAKRVSLWLFTDDWHGAMPIERVLASIKSIVPWADPHVTRYVVMLEYRETLSSDEHGQAIDCLNQLTSKPVYIHSGDDDIGGVSWPVRGLYLQYSQNTDALVAAVTKAAVAQWGPAGKEVIAAEFGNPTVLEESRRLSAVALAAGSSGTAQG